MSFDMRAPDVDGENPAAPASRSRCRIRMWRRRRDRPSRRRLLAISAASGGPPCAGVVGDAPASRRRGPDRRSATALRRCPAGRRAWSRPSWRRRSAARRRSSRRPGGARTREFRLFADHRFARHLDLRAEPDGDVGSEPEAKVVGLARRVGSEHGLRRVVQLDHALRWRSPAGISRPARETARPAIARNRCAAAGRRTSRPPNRRQRPAPCGSRETVRARGGSCSAAGSR